MKKSVVAAKFGIPPSTLSTIMKNKDIQKNFENNCKTMKKSRICFFPNVNNKCIRKWLEQYCGEGVPISGSMFQKKLKTLLQNSDLMV